MGSSACHNLIDKEQRAVESGDEGFSITISRTSAVTRLVHVGGVRTFGALAG